MDTSIIVIILCAYVLLAGIPAALAFEVLSRIPPRHRQQSPGLAFLLLVPFFALVWTFYVHPRVARSLRSYFISIGDSSVGDCGESLAFWFCLCSITSAIPFIGMFSGVAALVLLIVFYVRAFELSSKIPEDS